MLSINKLSAEHDRKAFDCGVEPLNRFLHQQASQILKRKETVIYVAHDGQKIAGFYTLSACEIVQSDDPLYLKKQSPHNPIPCILLGRLAVDVNYRGIGLGGDLLLNALRQTKQFSELLGMAFVIVDAKDETAKAFYEYFGFFALQTNPMRLAFAISQIPDE